MGNDMSTIPDVDDEDQLKTSYTFEIANFSNKKASIRSPTFLSGEFEWCVEVDPRKNDYDNYLWLFLAVENPYSCLSTRWKIRAIFRFILSTESGKVLYRTDETPSLFSGQVPARGVSILPLWKLKQKGFLENDTLIIKVEVKVVKVGYVTGMEMSEVETFEVPLTQCASFSKRHPDIAVDFKPKSQVLKTAYMNVLLALIHKLRKPPQYLSKTELRNAHSELIELTEAGFKLDWLKTKLEQVSLESKNAFADGSQVEEVEERIKNLELTLSHLKVELKSEKAKSAAAAAKILSV